MNQTKGWRKGWLLLLLALVFTCTFSLAMAEETSVWDQFQVKAEPQEGQAYIEVIPMNDPVKLTNVNGNDIWRLDFWVMETNGVGFTMEEFRTVHFDKDHNAIFDLTNTMDEMYLMFYTTYVEPYGYYMFNDAYPKEEGLSNVGVMITGTDDNGNKLTFSTVMNLSEEKFTDYTMADFAPVGTTFDNILFTSEKGDTICLIEDAGELWWATSVYVCNTSSEVLTIKEAGIYYFNSDGTSYSSLSTSGKSAAVFCQGGVKTLEPNTAFLIHDWCPNGDLSAVGLRVVLENPLGETSEGTLLLNLSKEVAAE